MPTPRRLPAALAAITEQLELEEASHITLERIADLARAHGIKSKPSDLAWRLKQLGWLLPTSTRGVWLFAPAAHAGPYSRGDDWATLRGVLERRPDLDVRVSLVSALWLLGLSERAPSRHELSGPAPANRLPAGLTKTYRYTRFDARLPPITLQGLAVQDPATLLVHIATRPTLVTSWDAVENALPVLAAQTTPEALTTELQGRTASVEARLGYLLSATAPDLSDMLRLRRPPHTVRMGPHHSSRPTKYNARWNIADGLRRAQ